MTNQATPEVKAEKQIDLSFFDNLDLKSGTKGSINYAKARAAIESAMESRQTKRWAKQIVIEHLGGIRFSVDQPLRPGQKPKTDDAGNVIKLHSVRFPDGSVARY
jgi:hypothetical protein